MFGKKKKEANTKETKEELPILSVIDLKILDFIKKLIASDMEHDYCYNNDIYFKSNKYLVTIQITNYKTVDWYSKCVTDITHLPAMMHVSLYKSKLDENNNKVLLNHCSIKIAYDNIYYDECMKLFKERSAKIVRKNKEEMLNILGKFLSK